MDIRLVVLVIGKGGEQIAAIQSETECRIQFAPGYMLPLKNIEALLAFHDILRTEIAALCRHDV